jgi:hypothetical protein
MRYWYLLLLILLFSCDPRRRDDFGVRGYAPIYTTKQNAEEITVAPAKSTVHPGKIYAYGNYLFQVEQNEGIHIIDNSNPQQAHKISFLRVAAASELAIRSGYLYTNHLNDLVVIDLSDMNSPRVVNRVEDAFPQISQEYPPVNNCYFECVDPSKGVVIGWEEKQLDNAKCRR